MPSRNLQREIGANIRRLRQASGLTQRALARLAGMPNTTLSDLELGKKEIRANQIHRLAIALAVEPMALLREHRPISREEAALVQAQAALAGLPDVLRQVVYAQIQALGVVAEETGLLDRKKPR